MGLANTAKLLASLDLDISKFNANSKAAMGTLGQMESRVSKIGGLAQQGVGNAIGNIAKLGLVAGAGIGAAVKTGIDDLARLEDATTSVDGAIEQLGLTGQLTSKQVAVWANDIERNVQAAFDDKEITAAAATLLRYGKVAPKNLKPALQVMTDLAAKTGSVESAAQLLAKALADPAKAAGKLAKAGVVLTKAQQDQVKAMVAVGDEAGAQAFLLGELEKATKGAAAASKGPYADALNILADAGEDARKALAIGFLPVLEKVAGKLSTALADPKIVGQIEAFGRGLAGALDSLIGIAEKLPWATIGESLKIAGAGAKTLLDAFVALPPWVQTAVLTGWGLNKLTGGALGGIVSELGKGLIKGVLGITAGVVNVTGATVNGVPTPGAPGAPTPPGSPTRNVPGQPGGGILDWIKNAIVRASPTGLAIDATVNDRFGINAIRAELNAGSAPQKEAARLLAEISTHTQRDGEIGRDQTTRIDAVNATLERNRLDIRSATDSVAAASRRAADALERKQQQAVNVTVNVDAQFTVRDITRKTGISTKLGFVAS